MKNPFKFIGYKPPEVLTVARGIREDQTFNLYAQKIENLWKNYAGQRMSVEQAYSEYKLILKEIEFVKEAIKNAQEEFKNKQKNESGN